jgi:hypothetical protein
MQPGTAESGFDLINHIATGGGRKPIPQNHIGARQAGPAMIVERFMRHRMAVDQCHLPESRTTFANQAGKGGMIGMPMRCDSRCGLSEGDFAVIDCPSRCNHARDHPKARRYPRIMALTGHPLDHGRIQLFGSTVEINIGAWRMGNDQGHAQIRGTIKQPVHKGIL